MPFSDSISELNETNKLDLTLKLSELSHNSWFAVHYNFLKASETQISTLNMESADWNALCKTAGLTASFLVYYRLAENKIEMIGILPFKMDDKHFWHGF